MITPRGRSTVWVRLDMWLSSMPVRWNMAQHMYVPAWPDGWDIFVMLWVLYAYKTNLGYYSVPINWIYLTLYGLLRTPCILLCGCSSFSLGLAARGALLEHATHCIQPDVDSCAHEADHAIVPLANQQWSFLFQCRAVGKLFQVGILACVVSSMTSGAHSYNVAAAIALMTLLFWNWTQRYAVCLRYDSRPLLSARDEARRNKGAVLACTKVPTWHLFAW